MITVSGKKKPQKLNVSRGATLTDVALGQRVRARRMQMGRSQSELAGKLGVSFQQVQKYEKGTNKIGTTRLIEIANALETPLDYFVGDLGNGKIAISPIDAFMATRDGIDMAEAMIELGPFVRRTVIELARKLGTDMARRPLKGGAGAA